jgi:polar amino acid transport system substrate-binding protein
MTARSPRRWLLATGALAASGALLLTGCGDQTDDSDGGSNTSPQPSASGAANAKPADLLPQKYKNSKVIKVGSDIAYPPVEFREKGKAVGLDIDLANAMGKELGVTFQFNNGTFDSLLTNLRSKRYDVVMSAMSDTKERQEGRKGDKKISEGVDFVDYFTAGVSLYVKRGNPEGIRSWEDLCGKKVVVQRGTVSNDQAKAKSQECEENGRSAIEIEAFDTDVNAQTRLRSGGADAGSSDYPVAAYAVKTSGGGKDFELIGEQELAGPYGIAVSKDNTQLRDALHAALQAIIDNGEYAKVLEKWGVEQGAITGAMINGGS